MIQEDVGAEFCGLLCCCDEQVARIRLVVDDSIER